MSFYQFLIIVVCIAVYLIPFWIAVKNKHRHKYAIGALAVFSGLFFSVFSWIGWFGAIVWALMNQRTQ